MGAIHRGRARYFLEYESDRYDKKAWDAATKQYGSFIHCDGYHGTLKTCKGYISQIRREKANENPRNFRIYDSYADVDEATGHVPCVYESAI